MPFERVEFFQDELLKAGHEDVKFVSEATIAAMLTKPKELTPQEGRNTYPFYLPSASIAPTLVAPATLKSKEGYQVPSASNSTSR
jgi:hypothetical protein